MFKNLLIRKSILLDIVLADDVATYKLSNYFKADGDYSLDTFNVSNITNGLSVTIPSLEISNISNSALRDHALEGFLLKAKVTVTLKDTSTDETYKVFKGQVQRVTIMDHWIDLDCQGFLALCEQNLNVTYTKECLNDLGDSNCGVTLATYTDTGTVTTVNSRSSFIDTSLAESDNHYQYGLVTFTSGSNNGLSREVLSYDSATDTVTLFVPFPYDITIGDTYSIYRGCQKDQSDCQDVFDNWAKFRGYAVLTPAPEDLRYDSDEDEDEIDEEDDDSDDQEI